MKIIALSLFCILLCIQLSYSQTKDESAVIEKAEALRKALIDPDKSTLDKLVHADLSYGHSSGIIETKEVFMQALLSEESNFVDITISEQTIKITGSTAVVRHKLAANLHNKGKDPSSVNLGVLLK